MRPIPKKMLQQILDDPFYQKCIRDFEGKCKGRITLEHSLIWAGRQINDIFAIVPVCACHHEVDEYQNSGQMDKQVNQLAALLRATPEDLKKYPRVDWEQEKKRLIYIVTKRYGENYIRSLYRRIATK